MLSPILPRVSLANATRPPELGAAGGSGALRRMSKAKGSRAERRAIRILEAAGYTCTKAGGSLGVFDVIAIGPRDIRAIQVKAGTCG